MQYRCETVSVTGFVQQLVNLITHGYRFYVTGILPRGKEPRDLDAKIVKKYDLNLRDWTRSRRKKAGRANVQYLRYGRFFIIIATHGRHRFFSPQITGSDSGEGRRDENDEECRIRDIRRSSIKFHGYSISQRPSDDRRSWHAHVRIDKQAYRELKAHLVELGRRRTVAALKAELRGLRFEPYFAVRRQMLFILRAMNSERRCRGFKPVPEYVLRTRLLKVKPFGEEPPAREAA